MNCPKCRSTYTLKDDSLGKTVRCKKCQTMFTVEPPAADEEVVAAVVEPEPGPEPEPVAKVKRKERPARSLPNMSPGLMILAGVAGVLLLISCCGGVSLTGYYIFAGGKHGGSNGLDGKYVVESACLADS